METHIASKPLLKPGAIIVGLVGVIVFVFDQITKYLVIEQIGMGNVWYPLPAFDFLRIIGSYNTGTACGYFPQLSIVFTFAPFVILAVVIWFYRSQKSPSWLLSIGVGLIMGGAFGNLIDRLRFGYVVDFVQVGTFPIFNVADSAVSTAVVLMLLWSLREDASHSHSTPSGEGDTKTAGDSSWKLGLVFVGILALVAVAVYFVCVFIPSNLPQ